MAGKCKVPFKACYHCSYRLSASLAMSSNLLRPEKHRSNGKLPTLKTTNTLSIDLRLAPLDYQTGNFRGLILRPRRRCQFPPTKLMRIKINFSLGVEHLTVHLDETISEMLSSLLRKVEKMKA